MVSPPRRRALATPEPTRRALAERRFDIWSMARAGSEVVLAFHRGRNASPRPGRARVCAMTREALPAPGPDGRTVRRAARRDSTSAGDREVDHDLRRPLSL